MKYGIAFRHREGTKKRYTSLQVWFGKYLGCFFLCTATHNHPYFKGMTIVDSNASFFSEDSVFFGIVTSQDYPD